MKDYYVDSDGFFGRFGGAYVPEILYKSVQELQNKYLSILGSDSFQQEYQALLKDYVGRPTPLYEAKRMSGKYGCHLAL
ncbi:MAG: tryptophan synthase subunit beta, partial [Prevotella sp.]|nr:tryptophan synthase subunit beta [Prevotella sp.]